MKEYIFLLMGVVLVSSITSMLAPNTDLRRYVSLVICLCVLSATVRPLVYLGDGFLGSLNVPISDASDRTDYESVFNDTLIEANEESFCELLKSRMMLDMGMTESEFEVIAKIYEENREYKLASLTVVLYGTGITRDPRKLKDFTRTLLGVECEVIYG